MRSNYAFKRTAGDATSLNQALSARQSLNAALGIAVMPLIIDRAYLEDRRTVAAKRLVAAASQEMSEIASRASAYGLACGRRRALAMVAQMGTELIGGAATLYEQEQWYAGAALVRQVIEVEYLLWLAGVRRQVRCSCAQRGGHSRYPGQ